MYSFSKCDRCVGARKSKSCAEIKHCFLLVLKNIGLFGLRELWVLNLNVNKCLKDEGKSVQHRSKASLYEFCLDTYISLVKDVKMEEISMFHHFINILSKEPQIILRYNFE